MLSSRTVTPTTRRLAIPLALLLTALAAGCGDDIVLPEPGEAANLDIIDGDEQVGQAGVELPDQVVVRVTDTRGRAVANQDVTFSIGSGGGSVAPTTVKTNTAGDAAADWTLGPNAGVQLLRVQTLRGGSTTNLEVTFEATAIAGTGSVLVGITGDDQTGPVNSALADSLVVKATDALGNPVSNVEVTWTVTGGGSISPATVLTGDDGLAAVERVLGATAGAQSAQATVPGFIGSPVTFSHTAVPANPTALVLVRGDDQIGPAGFALAESLVVRLEDNNGNGIGNRSISWIVSSGSGTVSPTTATTDPNGLAATSWTLPGGVGNYSVSGVFSGLPPVQFTATATADAPTTIALASGNNQSATVGTALPNPLVVRVTDAGGNPVENVGVTWTAEVGGSVSESNTATDASGLAQVTRTLGQLPGPYITKAEVVGLSGSPVTFTSTATVGPPARLVFVTQPGTPTASGDAFDPAPVIQVQDAQGNSVLQGGIQVAVSITSGQEGAALQNAQPRNTNSNGRANFSGLRISGPPDDDYVLTFIATVGETTLPPLSSGFLTVTAGAADIIVVLQQPSATAQSGDVFDQQPVVQVQDGSGNPISGSRTIAVELGQGDGSGVLIGDVTVSTNGGSTATFTDLGIAGATGNYTLIFRSGTLTPGESSVIAVVNSPPTADDEAYDANEDNVLTVLAASGVLVGDVDPDGDNLTAVNASVPGHGSVTLQTNGGFTYTPDADYNGPDSFTYQASDGHGNLSSAATVSITVNSVNDAPTFTTDGPVSTSSLTSSILGESHPDWVNNPSPGPSDEGSQTVTFEVTTDNDGAFQVGETPTVDPVTLTLSYRPVLVGATVVVNASVVARDDGPDGGATSAPQDFTITIDP